MGSVNYVNNNDLVPRLPGNFNYICSVLKRVPSLSLGFCRIGLVQIDVSQLLCSVEADGAQLERYRCTAQTIFVGHTKPGPGDGPHSPNFSQEMLDIELAFSPENRGLKNRFSGQVYGA